MEMVSESEIGETGVEGEEGVEAGDRGHPLRTPLLAYFTTRVALAAIAVGSAAADYPEFGRAFLSRPVWKSAWEGFSLWDGQWYLAAATRGYGQAGMNPDGQSTSPFFPLLPWLIRGLSKLGLPPALAGLAVANLAFVVALLLLYRISMEAGGERLATRAVWIAAVAPFSLALTMIYPDSIFLAASIGAFIAVRRRKWWLVVLCVVLATLARPNGLVLVLPIAWAIWGEDESARWRILRIAPLALAFVAFAGWAAALGRMTGDYGAFASSKTAWREIPIWELIPRAINTVTGGGERIPGGLLPHLAVFVAAIAALWWGRRILERGWLLLCIVVFAGPVILGVVGLGRYAAGLFPVYVAGAAAIEPGGTAERVLLFAAGAAMVVVAAGVFSSRLVP